MISCFLGVALAAPFQIGNGDQVEAPAPVGGRVVGQHVFDTEEMGQEFITLGIDSAPLQDFDGDGFGDFAVARAPRFEPGRIEFYSGGTGNLVDVIDWQGDWGIGPLAVIGDVTGDGISDLLVHPNYGRAELRCGLTRHLLVDFDPGISGVWHGAPIGDVDADGVPDFALLRDDYVQSQGGFIEEVRVFSGADARFLYAVPGGSIPYAFYDGGEPVAGLGDVNADGHDDFVVGSYREPTTQAHVYGIVRVHSGSDGSVIREHSGVDFGNYLGITVTALQDRDGDGELEYLVAADAVGSTAGRVIAFSGASGAELFRIQGSLFAVGFGQAASTVPDLDGDGVEELLIGSPWRSLARGIWFYVGYQGVAHLYSGSSLRELARIEGPTREPFRMTGHAVWSVDDLSGDGLADLGVVSYGIDAQGFLTESTVQVLSFEPLLRSAVTSLSAAAGGMWEMKLDFPTQVAGADYQVLLAARLGGQTEVDGVGIPLSADPLFKQTMQGHYPFAAAGALRGQLDAEGNRVVRVQFAPGALTSAVGRTYEYAAVARDGNGEVVLSSIPLRLRIDA